MRVLRIRERSDGERLETLGYNFDLNGVRVFFRVFNVAVTGLEFNGALYSRQGDGTNAAPLLGMAGGEIASIPFFAEAREADMRNQVDATNRKALEGAGAPEVTVYFGCWLDFNQTTPRFPLMPPHNGNGRAFGGSLLSIQQLVRNDHCCLVAEIHYPPDAIPAGATPGSHDNLSQRNLVVVESDNPGSAATDTVQSTFEIKPSAVPVQVPQAFGMYFLTPPSAQDEGPRAVARPGELLAALPDAVMAHHQPMRAVVAAPPAGAQANRPRREADELMIRWNNLPRDSRVSLYPPVGIPAGLAFCRERRQLEAPIPQGPPSDLTRAIAFGLLYAAVLVGVAWAQDRVGETGNYAVFFPSALLLLSLSLLYLFSISLCSHSGPPQVSSALCV